MKKILAIVGSPRRGDTLLAVERLAQELAGQAENETVRLSGVALSDCKGRHVCIMKGSAGIGRRCSA